VREFEDALAAPVTLADREADQQREQGLHRLQQLLGGNRS
jgi:hypothetical protein